MRCSIHVLAVTGVFVFLVGCHNTPGVGRNVSRDERQSSTPPVAEPSAARSPAEEAYFQGLSAYLANDYLKALPLLRSAAEQGVSVAQNVLGQMYEYGHGVPVDYDQAIKWLRKAADQGEASADLHLGDIYSAREDYDHPLESYHVAADRGDNVMAALAQTEVGDAYAFGKGVPKDARLAVEWYRKAAERGYYRARYLLGIAYLNGNGIEKDEKQGADWLRKAASQGDTDAQLIVGTLFAEGRGLPKDDGQAAIWYRKAADQGNVVAQFLLGSHLAQGRGVPKDDRQAAEWYRKAADQGHPGAQFFLGLSYAAGEGVARSESMSIEFLNKSALGFLDEGDREWALRSYDEIRSIDPQHLYVPRLRQQLFPPTPNDGAQAVKPEVVVAATGTAWPTADGYVITDRHVIAGATKITLVSTDGARVLATAVAVDASNDLALLRVDDPTRLPPGLPIAAQSVQLGERVFTIGYPHPDVMGARPRLTEGIVNALVGFGDDPRFLQISAAILGGNSGGPLLNARGEVVGIVTSKLDAIKMFKMTGDLPENVGYAIKAGYLRPLLDSAPANQKRAATILSSQEASLPDLAKRVEGSVLLIICE